MSLTLAAQSIRIGPPVGFLERIRARFHPNTDALDQWIIVFAVLGPFTNIPQLLQIFETHRADLSVASWMLYFFFNIPFIAHGIIRKDRIVLFNSSLTMVMQGAILAGILLYQY